MMQVVGGWVGGGGVGGWGGVTPPSPPTHPWDLQGNKLGSSTLGVAA